MIFLSLPNYGQYEPQSLFTILGASKKHDVKIFSHTSSMLVDSFNTCWCEMLNTPDVEYFAMLHADVITEGPWLDTLVDELEAMELDVLSVVLPLKDEKGITSTGILSGDEQVTRLTLSEVSSLSDTFDADDIGESLGYEGTLLVNTGMWVAKVGDWMKKFDGFRAHSQIVKKNGLYETLNSPEDWDFSVWCSENGVKVAATSLIKAGHVGKKTWRNDQVYGQKSDMG